MEEIKIIDEEIKTYKEIESPKIFLSWRFNKTEKTAREEIYSQIFDGIEKTGIKELVLYADDMAICKEVHEQVNGKDLKSVVCIQASDLKAFDLQMIGSWKSFSVMIQFSSKELSQINTYLVSAD